MAFEEITYDVDAGRAHIVFNRPEKRNALSPLLLQELNDALWEADDDRRVHAVCISGAGSCFSAGYDLGAAYDHRGARRPTTTGPATARAPRSTTTCGSWSGRSACAWCCSTCTSR